MNLSEWLPDDFKKTGKERLQAFETACRDAGFSSPLNPRQSEWLSTVLAVSEFVSDASVRYPEILCDLFASGDLHRSYAPEAYAVRLQQKLDGTADESDLMKRLRDIRRQEMLRIACRDLGALSNLSEVTAELSALADACIRSALSFLHDRHCRKYGTPCDASGRPMQMTVLGMGKLGARELNFSSDIDLIFFYPEPGETRDGERSVSNGEFFLELARRLIHVLGAKTADGQVFRVDMNLRPFGESGPLVMSFDAAETYYHEQGREWERYAWIKTRVVTGDAEAGALFMETMRPFVFRRYLDYGVFDSLREMKQKITVEIRRKGMREDIKLGPGGIREVEFFGQIFQLIRGGVESALQKRGIREVLAVLFSGGYISKTVRDELLNAYIFLRNTEHRLQEFSDAQTHRLPREDRDRARLAAVMGFQCWTDFAKVLSRHRENVHQHFSQLLKPEAKQASDPSTDSATDSSSEKTCVSGALTGLCIQPAETADGEHLLADAGYRDPENALKQLKLFRENLGEQSLSREGRIRIDRLVPIVLEKAGKTDDPETVLDRVLSLIHAVRRRTSYVSLLLENCQAVDHLIRLAKASSWIIQYLISHPVVLDELLDPRTLFTAPERDELKAEIQRRLSSIDPDDLERQMDELRIFRQVSTLRVAAADISDAMPLMRVSDHLSYIAEAVLAETLRLSWDHLKRKHGTPVCDPPLEPGEQGFTVIAYGKLGGLELGYGSDLDLVFLHSGTPAQTEGGRMPVDGTTFFARLGQRVLHFLTTFTNTGRLYEADMRLRPSGDSGMLVSSYEQFRKYQLEDAWIWETQALIRARPIAGDRRLMGRFEEIRKEVLCRKWEPEELRTKIRDMRDRMRKELLEPSPDTFDLKQGDGGMVDIEFLIQFLTLRHAQDHPGIIRWTDSVRLIRTLMDAGILDEKTAYYLRRAYLIQRATGHRLSLREKPAEVPSARFPEMRRIVRNIWKRFLEPGSMPESASDPEIRKNTDMSVLMEFAIFPTDRGESVSAHVRRVIRMIRESGRSHTVTAMGTIIETESMDDALEVLRRSYEILEPESNRIYATVKFDIRRGGKNRMEEKVRSVEKGL